MNAANRNRHARPTRITRADHARQARAIAEWDRRAASARRRERAAMFAVWAWWLAVGVTLFYLFTS